jgi:hypothetical protein
MMIRDQVVSGLPSNGASRPTKSRRANPTVKHTDQDVAEILSDLVANVESKAKDWQDELAVSIGLASSLTGLEDTKIRYFEDLKVLKAVRRVREGRTGSNRVYQMDDLRRLYALKLLEDHYTPANAASFVKENDDLIAYGPMPPSPPLLKLEGEASAATLDGFLLSKIATQLLYAAQSELDDLYTLYKGLGEQKPEGEKSEEAISGVNKKNSEEKKPKVVSLKLFKMKPEETISGANVKEKSYDLLGASDTLHVIDRAQIEPAGSGKKEGQRSVYDLGDESTLLLNGAAVPGLRELETCEHFFYTPSDDNLHTMILLVRHASRVGASKGLLELGITDLPELPEKEREREEERRKMHRQAFDGLLGLCAPLLKNFTKAPSPKLLYRIDGYVGSQTEEVYKRILREMRLLIFPDDDPDYDDNPYDKGSMACILVPDNLDQPTYLSILAQDGYPDDPGREARLELIKPDGKPTDDGLSGRAYNAREPFFSPDAEDDKRIEYAVEEHCKVALAVPIMMSGARAPLGVLYLASRAKRNENSSRNAFVGLLFGSILSELLGPWWLTRARRKWENKWHKDYKEMIHWLDGMGAHSVDLERGYAVAHKLWQEKLKEKLKEDLTTSSSSLANRQKSLALIVFDIDKLADRHQGKTADPFVLRAQLRISAVIKDLSKGEAEDYAQGYWFGNDHTLVIRDSTPEDVKDFARRVLTQVRLRPLSLPGSGGASTPISVSGAFKVIGHRALIDIAPDSTDEAKFRGQFFADVAKLRERTRLVNSNTLWAFNLNGDEEWTEVEA